jgi:hypothetical protein
LWLQRSDVDHSPQSNSRGGITTLAGFVVRESGRIEGMEPNPYESPEHVARDPETRRRPNPFVAVGLTILALAFAADLVFGGYVRVFIWGVQSEHYYQTVYGIFLMAAGVLILERLARYLRRFFRPNQEYDSLAGRIVAIPIWTIIVFGVVMDVVSIVLAFTR